MFSNLLLAALTLCAVSYDAARAAPSTSPSPRPLVVWHGMGDSYASPGMVEFQETVERLHPGIFVHRIFLNEDAEEDKKATYVRCAATAFPTIAFNAACRSVTSTSKLRTYPRNCSPFLS